MIELYLAFPRMWKCKQCTTDVEDDSWESCWKCGYTKAGEKPASPTEITEFKLPGKEPKQGIPIDEVICTRCKVQMNFAGNRLLHTGGPAAELILGPALGVSHLEMVLFACPRCAKVEFFSADILRRAQK